MMPNDRSLPTVQRHQIFNAASAVVTVKASDRRWWEPATAGLRVVNAKSCSCGKIRIVGA